MTEYQRKKESARRAAIEWQNNFDKHNYSWFQLCLYQERFEKLGKKYGLTKEFRENGII